MRRLLPLIGLVAAVASCGGGDGGPTTPPAPPAATIASVEVTPPSASLVIPETVQLSATPKDASGKVLTGKAITWSSSATTVATVSGSGLVSSVAEGVATITATADGKAGSSVITVTRVEGGPLVARADIGAGGGTVGTTDVAVTIPAGAFTSTRTLYLIRDTLQNHPFPANAASPIYRIDGVPAGQTVQARVRIRVTGTRENQAAIAMGTPVVSADSTDLVTMGFRLFAATDSSGYLIATVPIRGRPASWAGGGAVRSPFRASTDPLQVRADAELAGINNVRHRHDPNGHFEGWGFVGGGVTLATVEQQIGIILPLLEKALTKIEAMGFPFAFENRTTWPMDAYLTPLVEDGNPFHGAYYFVAPFPYDPDQSYLAFHPNQLSSPTVAGLAMHEVFHAAQHRSHLLLSEAQFEARRWIAEATSTWIEELHPSSPSPYPAPTALSWRDSLFSGLDHWLDANAGYGKAPMIKYLANRWGNAVVNQLFNAMATGTKPVDALVSAAPVPPSEWWPDLLREHLQVGLYQWGPRERLPEGPPYLYTLPTSPGQRTWWFNDAHFLSTSFLAVRRQPARFSPVFELPVSLKPSAAGKAVLLAFRKTPGSAGYELVDQGETVRFPGWVLNSTDTLLVALARTENSPGHANIDFTVDLPLGGDWRFPEVWDVEDGGIGYHYCDQEGDRLNLADNLGDFFDGLSSGGTWRSDNGVDYNWVPRPTFADTLRQQGITAWSRVTAIHATNVPDSVIVQGGLKVDYRLASSPPGPWPVPTLPPWVWVLATLVGLPLLISRRPRPAFALAPAAVVALAIVACDDTKRMVRFGIDETFDFRFGEFRFTADPSNPEGVLVELRDGQGTTRLISYDQEYWLYTRDSEGAIVDSTKRTCHAMGEGSYRVSGDLLADGVLPSGVAAAPSVTDLIRRYTGR